VGDGGRPRRLSGRQRERGAALAHDRRAQEARRPDAWDRLEQFGVRRRDGVVVLEVSPVGRPRWTPATDARRCRRTPAAYRTATASRAPPIRRTARRAPVDRTRD